MKKWIKRALTMINCLAFGIKYKKGLYIGLGSKIVGGGKIELSDNVKLMPQSMLVALGRNGHIEIGDFSEISMYSRIASVGFVKIGNHVLTGPHIFIADYNHEYRDPLKPVMHQGNRFVPKVDGSPNILIGDGTWIGTNVVIVGNVHIGKHCVIGANSVVTKDIPDYCVAVGQPAKVVRRYSFEKGEWVKVLQKPTQGAG